MSVTVVDHTQEVLTNISRQTNLALRFMIGRIDDTANPKTPKKEGRLRGDVLKSVLGLSGTITWSKKYAQAQEAGIVRGSRVRHYTTPGTGPHFAEDAVKKVVSTDQQDFSRAGVI
jgi:Minor capsid protein